MRRSVFLVVGGHNWTASVLDLDRTYAVAVQLGRAQSDRDRDFSRADEVLDEKFGILLGAFRVRNARWGDVALLPEALYRAILRRELRRLPLASRLEAFAALVTAASELLQENARALARMQAQIAGISYPDVVN